jgi:hypothetical protein
VILKEMTSPDRPWNDIHHRYYFLPELRRVEARELFFTVNGDSPCSINHMAMHEVYAKGNMERIATTIPTDISKTPGVVGNVFFVVDFSLEEIRTYTKLFKELCDVFSCSYEEMPGIYARIVDHEITTYPDAN